jgi:hypothetical protein
MTSLRKDGLPVVPICIECEHRYDEVFDSCGSPNRERNFDPIYGYTYKSLRCRDARADNNLCGTAGNWYEPKKVVKPTLRQRIRRWLFS